MEAAQRLQAASHAAMVVYDGLKGLVEHMRTVGQGMWTWYVGRICWHGMCLEVSGLNPAIAV